MNWIVLAAVLCLTINFCVCETGCPPADKVAPCECYGDGDIVGLTCGDLTESETLRQVFLNSARYEYELVTIQDSVLNYIPHQLFEDVRINRLVVENLTLTDIFDEPPKTSEHLRQLRIERTKVLRGVVWEFLEPMTALDYLEVFNVTVKVIKDDLGKYASDKLRYIAFHGTETASLKPGAFTKFVNLERFYIDYGKISEISREAFPIPFESIKTLSFNGHPTLDTLPDGMYLDMPNLEIVGLQDNNLSTVNSKAFGGVAYNISMLSFIGNPLECDCRIYWLLETAPPGLKGSCAGPERLKGRQLISLRDEDMNC